MLTIQGQDMADHPLLAFSETQPTAFSDQIPKPIPKRTASGDWPAEYDTLRQDTGGDTLHRLGELHPPEPLTWSMATPILSSCEENGEDGSVICPFGEGYEEESGMGNAETTAARQGRVRLQPKRPSAPGPENLKMLPTAFLEPADAPGLTHTGFYWLSQDGLELEVIPPMAWFPGCPAEDPLEARCQGSDPTAPGHTDPPPDSTEPTTLDWQIASEQHVETNTCELRITWGSNEEQVLTLTLQPHTLCQDVPASGTLQATATCTWQETEMVEPYVWTFAGTVDETSSYGSSFFYKYQCERRSEIWATDSLDCSPNPKWEQEPAYTPPPLIQPGEPGFTPYQLQAVTFADCERRETAMWLRCPYGPPPPLCGYRFRAYLADTTWYQQYYGQWVCETAARTYAQWEGVANCRYEKTGGDLAIQEGYLQFVLSP